MNKYCVIVMALCSVLFVNSSSVLAVNQNTRYFTVTLSFLQDTLGKEISHTETQQIPGAGPTFITQTNNVKPLLLIPTFGVGYAKWLNAKWEMTTEGELGYLSTRIKGVRIDDEHYDYSVSGPLINASMGLRYWQHGYAWVAKGLLGFDQLQGSHFSSNGGNQFANKSQFNVTYGLAVGVLKPLTPRFTLGALVSYQDLGSVAQPSLGAHVTGSTSTGSLKTQIAGISFGIHANYQF